MNEMIAEIGISKGGISYYEDESPNAPLYIRPSVADELVELLFTPRYSKSYQGAPRIAVVEDHVGCAKNTCRILLNAGLKPEVWLVNNKGWTSSLTPVSQLANLIAYSGVQAAVMDKSLGTGINGIRLTELVTEHLHATIMLTGEPDTRETHRVATRYLERGSKVEQLLIPMIEELTGLKPTQMNSQN
jgi:hypothetical protein